VDEGKARELVASAISAAREQVEYSRALHAAERRVILLGPNAGQFARMRAELHHKKRNSQLRLTKQLLAKSVEGLREDRRKQVAEFFQRRGLDEFVEYTRDIAVLHLIDTESAPDEIRLAVQRLDATLSEVRGLSSLDAVTRYLQHHIDELIEGRQGNPNPDGFCLLILILSSLFAILVLIALLICIFTFGLACEGILEQLIKQVCG